jgi:tetratricopeptide (TPR) repeat protein
MPSRHNGRYDFFLSRRGSVAAIASEVADVLTEKGYKVLVQDYDIPRGASFIEGMHEAVKNSRDLIILFTRDYEQSHYTRKEFTSFEAQRGQSVEKRHIVVLRCEDVPLRGLLADNVYQDLVGITDPEERKHRIIAAAERQSQAAPPPPRPFIGVPPCMASFTGRADELDRLDAILMSDKAAAVKQSVGRAAVQGLGGIGKTSLATEYAHRYRRLYAGVCWCPGETRMGLLTSLAGLAVTLGFATSDEADVEKAARAALSRLSERRAIWLLVYDNVASPDEVADLLPSDGARVLITSRFSDWSAVADEVSLDVLPLEEAAACLQTRTGRNDREGAKTLAETLGCLPLALDHAAAYCKRTQMRFIEYAAKTSSLIATAPRGVNYPRSVAATFDLAIAEAALQCASAEALMAFLAQCAPERIPTTLVEGAMDDEDRRLRALGALAELSLVKHDPFGDGTQAVTVHRLVQAAVCRRSEAKGTTKAVTQSVIGRLAEVYPHDGYYNPQSWALCARLTPHLLALQKADPESISEAGLWSELLERAGLYFLGRAYYAQAEPLLCKALRIREKVCGPEHLDTAKSLKSLVLLRRDQGNLPEARLLCERALAIREKMLGPKHPDTAWSVAGLALLLQDQGDLAQAQRLHERALAIREEVLGPDHPDTAWSLNMLGRLLKEQGDQAGARPRLERALAIYKKVRGHEHPDTAMSLNELAMLFHAEGNVSEARSLVERVLAIRKKVLGPEHPDTATSMHQLAYFLKDEGDTKRALPLSERAVAIREKVLGPGHPWTKDSARVNADALDALGRSSEATGLRERYGITTGDNPLLRKCDQ